MKRTVSPTQRQGNPPPASALSPALLRWIVQGMRNAERMSGDDAYRRLVAKRLF